MPACILTYIHTYIHAYIHTYISHCWGDDLVIKQDNFMLGSACQNATVSVFNKYWLVPCSPDGSIILSLKGMIVM